MGQIEVYEWLKIQRRSGDHRYWSVRQIEKGIHDCGLFPSNGRGVWGAVVTLESFGYLEVRKIGRLRDFKRVVRLKNKYCLNKT